MLVELIDEDRKVIFIWIDVEKVWCNIYLWLKYVVVWEEKEIYL